MKYTDGIYYGIPHDEYHAIEAVSNSYLSRLAKCPACAKVPQEDKPVLNFGRAFHSYILERESFNNDVAILPEINRKTKEGKELYETFIVSNKGKAIISQEDFVSIQAMSDAVHNHPTAGPLVKAGNQEVSIFWTDESDVQMKARPDIIPMQGSQVLLDLKKVRSASYHSFQSSIVTYGYHRQSAVYLDGMSAVTGEDYDTFMFICVEEDAPYRVECYALTSQFINIGRDEYRRLLKIELECRKNNHWPHYKSAEAQIMEAPAYLISQNNKIIEEES